MAVLNLKVEGMSCGHCVRAVTQALEGVEGVRSARVDLQAGNATVEYDDTVTGPGDLVDAVTEEGYGAEELP